MTCEACRAKDKQIALLRRDLLEAQQAVDVMTQRWLQAKEKKK